MWLFLFFDPSYLRISQFIVPHTGLLPWTYMTWSSAFIDHMKSWKFNIIAYLASQDILSSETMCSSPISIPWCGYLSALLIKQLVLKSHWVCSMVFHNRWSLAYRRTSTLSAFLEPLGHSHLSILVSRNQTLARNPIHLNYLILRRSCSFLRA
jgi:hypothetical protein